MAAIAACVKRAHVNAESLAEAHGLLRDIHTMLCGLKNTAPLLRRRRQGEPQMASSVPLSVDIVAIVACVKRGQTEAKSLAEAQESLRDIHTMLCGLLSSVLTAPLTGRMFVPMPTAAGGSDAAAAASAASMRAQLL